MTRKSTNDLLVVIQRAKKAADRLKLTLPFPVDAVQFYHDCLPEELWTALRRLDVQGLNCNTLMTWTNCVQLTLMSEAAYRDPHRDVIRDVFWLKLPFEVPQLNGETSAAILVPPRHPARGAAVEWTGAARKVDAQIDLYERVLDDVYAEFGSVQELAQFWPELVTAGRGTIPKRFVPIDLPRQRTLKRTLQAACTPQTRDLLVQEVTAASLLPDDLELKAWVDWTT